VNESNNIQDAIAEQERNLAGQIRENFQREIVREFTILLMPSLIFFGLSFDDFFGKISLDDILDEVLATRNYNSSEESASSDASSNAGRC